MQNSCSIKCLLPFTVRSYARVVTSTFALTPFFYYFFSDICKTSIADYHRSCGNCSFDLCITCCKEVRDGHLKGGMREVKMEYVNRGIDYLHGDGDVSELSEENRFPEKSSEDIYKLRPAWKLCDDHTIPCPPTDLGGCGDGILELRCIFSEKWVSKLVGEAEKLAKTYKHVKLPKFSGECPCSYSAHDRNHDDGKLRKAALREDSMDNHLYCPTVDDISQGDLKHFQFHWSKGEPVIVRNVLENTSGLSWEPMVMWRACRQIKKTGDGRHLDVEAIDCLDWSHVSSFFLIIYACLCFLTK